MSSNRCLSEILLGPPSLSKNAATTVIRNGLVPEVVACAAANDVDRSIHCRVSEVAPGLAKQFIPQHDDGGRVGFSNASTEALWNTTRTILSRLLRGTSGVAVKGCHIAALYPPFVHRQQNDLDLAVRSGDEFYELCDVLRNMGFKWKVLAVRIEAGKLEGSVSAERVDDTSKIITWCDVWIGVQALSLSNVRVLDAGFWAAALSKQREASWFINAALNLLAEVEERGLLRYRDVLDLWSIVEKSPDSQRKDVVVALKEHQQSIEPMVGVALDSADLFRPIFSHAYPELVKSFPSARPVKHLPLSRPIVSQRTIHSPPQQRMFSGSLVRFHAFSDEAGELAVGAKLNRLFLRTPIGLFVSEEALSSQ